MGTVQSDRSEMDMVFNISHIFIHPLITFSNYKKIKLRIIIRTHHKFFWQHINLPKSYIWTILNSF
jgi:hypothetical protein